MSDASVGEGDEDLGAGCVIPAGLFFVLDVTLAVHRLSSDARLPWVHCSCRHWKTACQALRDDAYGPTALHRQHVAEQLAIAVATFTAERAAERAPTPTPALTPGPPDRS